MKYEELVREFHEIKKQIGGMTKIPIMEYVCKECGGDMVVKTSTSVPLCWIECPLCGREVIENLQVSSLEV